MSFFAQYADDAHRCALMRIRCASADASAWPTLIFTVLNAKYVHPRPALLTDPFYKCNVITNVKNSCREITTTYLSAGHIESEAAGWKSGRLHCSLPRSDKGSSRSRLCWLRNNIYFPFAALRGNSPLFLFCCRLL